MLEPPSAGTGILEAVPEPGAASASGAAGALAPPPPPHAAELSGAELGAEPGLRQIAQLWWPLAASWLLMAAELPALVAVVARMPDPEIHLAAYGGVVFPLALIIESPVIQLLAASTALSRDARAYETLRRYAHLMGAGLTALHLALVLTPLFDVVVAGWIGAPPEIQGPARIGVLIMTPWTWTIAYRRFAQGALIRFGRSRTVGVGTAIRLSTVGAVLLAGYSYGRLPGIVVGSSAIAAGVTAEALYAALAVRPLRRGALNEAVPGEPVHLGPFVTFYTPLVLTSLLILLAQPIGSAAMTRLPLSLASLAVWPAISGPLFALRSLGFAYNEVVVATSDQPGSGAPLRRFALLLGAVASLLALALVATPLARLWLGRVSALDPELARLGAAAMWWGLPLPALSVAQSRFQGALVHARRTRGITEAVVIYLTVIGGVLLTWIGLLRAGLLPAWAADLPGVHVALATTVLAAAAQSAWLALRARPVLRQARA